MRCGVFYKALKQDFSLLVGGDDADNDSNQADNKTETNNTV